MRIIKRFSKTNIGQKLIGFLFYSITNLISRSIKWEYLVENKKSNIFKNISSENGGKEAPPSFSSENQEDLSDDSVEDFQLDPYNTPRKIANLDSFVRPMLSPLNQQSKWNIVRSVHAALGPEGWKRRESLLYY